MSKETKGRGAGRKHSASHWRLQNIAQESVESSDEEFFDARDVMEGKSAILLGMSQWNSNDLVEQIETLGHMEDQTHGMDTHTRTHTHTHTHTHSRTCTHYNQTHVDS
ncbi:membrane-associated phosphatidylinositol transfer protein 3 isoform X2 [Poecilia formosa]|uniref:membrane-associated phosphatidylinositol transfer protein 3 isoform X2 n=1 Tax=Poecilia formosa TaxID=48698 RepID=UPI0007B8A93D|nr:PREDICTED: membrane-associated phosphatidylinositol transfer protein 3 isoform X2 [Poecilia formosa]